MSVDVSLLDDGDFGTWDDLVERSPGSTVFHRSVVLRSLADATDVTLHPLIGVEAGTPVGVFPVFELDKGPFSVAVSPPPGMWATYLGPVMLAEENCSYREAERRRQQFIESCYRYVAREIDPVYTRVITTYRYRDIRPFQWQGYQAEPNYTYVVELTDEEDLLGRFSSDARRNVQDSYDDHVIEIGGREAIDRILDQVRRRYEEQGEPKSLPYAFARHLYREVDDELVYPYVYRMDGTFVGGILALADDDTVYRWLGGVKPAVDVDPPVNDLVDWRIMTDALADGYDYYDLVGAGNDRINRYKSKFNPSLRTFYRISSDSRLTDVAVATYEQYLEYKRAIGGVRGL